MVSFKLAAIKILKEAKEPLHYEEITKRALDNNLIETSGATPEATMNAIITTDIKNNKQNSAFVRVKPGYFTINPEFTEKVEKQEEQEEQKKEEEVKQIISTQYIGKAGEHIVVSELLFRGYNASIMSVDEGIDIVSTKNERLFNIQVKTANENKFGSYAFDIRISSLEKNNSNNTFYVFVLKGKGTRFLILPLFEIEKNINQKNILLVKSYNKYRVSIRLKDDKLYLGNLGNEMSYFMNNWGLIK